MLLLERELDLANIAYLALTTEDHALEVRLIETWLRRLREGQRQPPSELCQILEQVGRGTAGYLKVMADAMPAAKRYVCQKCGDAVPESELDDDGDGNLRHVGDVDCRGDPPEYVPIMCGPVFEEKLEHSVETCEDLRCDDPACVRDRKLEEAERRADGAREEGVAMTLDGTATLVTRRPGP